ncbi:MAG: Na+/proline symporter [Chloroflexi bacterium]|nr:Na+/proline symporter [Chloroflexota bacterium]
MLSATLVVPVMVITAAVSALLGILYVRRRRPSVEEYIVNRNTTGTAVGIATVVASVAGAWILFSPAETGTWAGIVALIGYSLGQAAPLVAFAIIGPRMRRLMPRGHSLTEYAFHRFGPAMYLFVLGVMLFYMFIFLSAELTGIAEAVKLVADIPLVWTAIIAAVGTIAYTSYGGIRASIFTDSVQFVVIIPLLIVVFIATIIALGGFGAAFDPVSETAPQLLSLGHRPGIEFGVTLVIAIMAAEMFHQGYWQRVYACRDEQTLRRAFLIGGIVVVPIVFAAGLFGIMAVGYDIPADKASVALFSLIIEALPTWVVLLVIVLALALVMSSMDTLLNGIASAVTSDLPRFRPGIKAGPLLRSSRALTVVVALPAIFIAAQGYSVLYLFLIADMVCAASVFPVFYGLYNRHLTGRAALASCILGIVAGVLFFPKSDFTPWLEFPRWLVFLRGGEGDFLVSFAAALGVSVVLAVVWSALASRQRLAPQYDYRRLDEQVQLIQG